MTRPRLVVDDPASYSPLPFGLLSIVQPADTGSPHWRNGVTYQARCANAGGTTYDECVSELAESPGDLDSPGEAAELDEPNPKAATTELALRAATPFTVYARFDCATVGNGDAAAVAASALAQAEPWQVERAFWTGVADGQPLVYPHLAATVELSPPGEPDVVLQTAAVNLGGPYDLAHGLGLLEKAMADCSNSAGVVHMPRVALPTASYAGVVRVANGRLLTTGGNTVAAGAGYPGSGPDGTAAPYGTVWLFGTGPVFRFAGAIAATQPADSIDRATNTMQMIAERTTVLGWGCCHFAVNVRLGIPTGFDES